MLLWIDYTIWFGLYYKLKFEKAGKKPKAGHRHCCTWYPHRDGNLEKVHVFNAGTSSLYSSSSCLFIKKEISKPISSALLSDSQISFYWWEFRASLPVIFILFSLVPFHFQPYCCFGESSGYWVIILLWRSSTFQLFLVKLLSGLVFISHGVLCFMISFCTVCNFHGFWVRVLGSPCFIAFYFPQTCFVIWICE